MTNLEIKKQFDKIDFSNYHDVILCQGLLFNAQEYPVDGAAFFSGFNKVIDNGGRIHIQVPKNFDFDKANDFYYQLSDYCQIKRSRISSYILLHQELDISRIAKKIIRKTMPAVAIDIVINQVKDASRIFNFNIKNKERSSYNGPKPSDVAIVIDDSFSSIKAEELHLSDYQVIKIYRQKKAKTATVKRPATKKAVPQKDQSKMVQKDNKNQEKIKKAELLHLDLKRKASEFLQNAMSYKKKSDEAKKIIDQINDNQGQLDSQDANLALKQCRIDEDNYSSMSKDFLSLYEQINEQIDDLKLDLKNLKKN